LLTVFAANNISTADENSAAANSFKTKQLLSGSNFLKLLFGIKNIFYLILLYFILFINLANAKACLSFLPYGFNDSYVHLPQSSSFCFKQGKTKYKYQTDNYGGRLLYGEALNDKIQVFGDSQVVGLDVEDIKQHYLNASYQKNNFVIYAAPNNGPYEVINFLNKNKKILQKKIIVTFNFATDLYRVLDYWDPKNFVALKDYELDEILEHPFKYKLIIFKNLLVNKNFTLSRYDNKKMQKVFLNSDQDELYKNLNKYFEELNKIANRLDIQIDFIVTHPYWVYSIDKKNSQLLLDKELNEKVEKLICNSFLRTRKINKILISEVSKNLYLDDLTIDKRHLKSNKIKLVDYDKVCGT
jgi:hypothetical protein